MYDKEIFSKPEKTIFILSLAKVDWMNMERIKFSSEQNSYCRQNFWFMAKNPFG